MARIKNSITEIPNALTTDIDLASPTGIVQFFRQVDSQIFNGWNIYEGMCDPEFLKRMKKAVMAAARVLTHKGSKKIIISGAGTSGRLAMFLARTFNRLARQAGMDPCFDYLIAGGDLALIKAQEGAEDDPHTAQKDLERAAGNAEKIFYVGVTCGFSAPYIAGQLDCAAEDEKYFSCLVGFNPPELARKIIIEHWDKNFSDVVRKIRNHPRCVLLNPVHGPEAITGSTRMKGGSATKIICEVLFTAAMIRARIISPNHLAPAIKSQAWDLDHLIFTMLRQYENTRVDVYRERDDIARLVELGGQALRHKKHIYYIGADTYGIIGTVDASECPPTFGARFEDVRGYLPGGWRELLDRSDDLSQTGPEYQISIGDFARDKLPHLSQEDLVVILGGEEMLTIHEDLLEKIKAKEARLCAVLVNPAYNDFPGFDAVVRLRLDPAGLIYNYDVLAEFGMKLVLNAITTGAHILVGKIYQNRMIDLNISNTKLFHRTLDIICSIVGADRETALLSTLKSIYKTDTPTEEHFNAPVSAHIMQATWKDKIVPRALLMATGRFNYQQAGEALAREPIVRAIIEKIAHE
ncbi:MAG TPA: hypothetical protein PLB62_09565 [Candidatus Sumerlaeota bacterium]|nr:hypothetical protein [Candidatus Sumerlaeota bacterium]